MTEASRISWSAIVRRLRCAVLLTSAGCGAEAGGTEDMTPIFMDAGAPSTTADASIRDASTGPLGTRDAGSAAAASNDAGTRESPDGGGHTGTTTADAGQQGALSDGGAVDASATDATSGDASGPGGDVTSVCEGGEVGMDSMQAAAAGLNVSREYGAVKYLAASGIEIVSLKTTLKVPKTPAQRQTLFIWPGLQCRGGSDPAGVRNGILQPVLTWGPSCNPNLPGASDYYDKWWVAGMYVNVSSGVAGPTGCAGGDFMLTEVGDLLDMDMSLDGLDWTQTITNESTNESVDFTIGLKGQVQNWATWAVEVPTGETISPAEDTVFTRSVLTFSKPVKTCQPDQAGPNDYYSAPVLSKDGLHCCYDEITLRKH